MLEVLIEPFMIDLPIAPTETKKSKHLLSISASELTAFVACDGYWNGLCIPLGIETGMEWERLWTNFALVQLFWCYWVGKLEIISVDAFEQTAEEDFGTQSKNMIICITTAEVCYRCNLRKKGWWANRYSNTRFSAFHWRKSSDKLWIKSVRR